MFFNRSALTIGSFALFMAVPWSHAHASTIHRYNNRIFRNVIGGRSAFDAIKARNILAAKQTAQPERTHEIQSMSHSAKIVAGSMLLILATCLALLLKSMLVLVSLSSGPRRNRHNRLKLCRPA